MTRKDYRLIAEVLHKQYRIASDVPMGKLPTETVRSVVYSLADVLQADNPNFKRDTFYAACGLEE